MILANQRAFLAVSKAGQIRPTGVARNISMKAKKVKEAMETRLKREVSLEEVAVEMGIDESVILRGTVQSVSLNAPALDDSDGSMADIIGDERADPTDEIDARMIADKLAKVLSMLPCRELEVAIFRLVPDAEESLMSVPQPASPNTNFDLGTGLRGAPRNPTLERRTEVWGCVIKNESAHIIRHVPDKCLG